jgi:diguanylate cyclase (GGDEF)-like protein
MGIISEKKFIPIKSVMRLVTTMVLTVIISFYVVTGIFVYVITEKEYENVQSRIDLAFNVEYKHNIDVLKEYAYWNEAYFFLKTMKDEKWIQKNINNYIFKMYDYEWLALDSGEGLNLITKRKSSPILKKDLKILFKNKNEEYREYKYIKGDLYEIISVYFVDEATQKKYKDKLVIGIKINKSYLDSIILKYDLPEIKLTERSGDEKLTLIGESNGEKSYLSWTYNSPTRNVIPYMAAMGLVLLIAFILIIRKMLSSELKESAKYEEALYSAATRDYLTGIANRRFFLDYVKKEFNLLTLEKRDLSILQLDIDFFKKINDKYGHSVGDRALVLFVEKVSSVLRDNDLIGRIGGEEFAVFLPDTTEETAINISKRIHNVLKVSPLEVSDGVKHNITVSVGGSTNKNKKIKLEDLIVNADKALYVSKENGRNRTTFL